MSAVGRQTGADPRLDTRLRGVFQLQREEPSPDWCVAARDAREISARQR